MLADMAVRDPGFAGGAKTNNAPQQRFLVQNRLSRLEGAFDVSRKIFGFPDKIFHECC
jgi:hypothetical protein